MAESAAGQTRACGQGAEHVSCTPDSYRNCCASEIVRVVPQNETADAVGCGNSASSVEARGQAPLTECALRWLRTERKRDHADVRDADQPVVRVHDRRQVPRASSARRRAITSPTLRLSHRRRLTGGQVRGTMIQAAWLWLKHQPKSAITRWFVQRTAGQSGRIRRCGCAQAGDCAEALP